MICLIYTHLSSNFDYKFINGGNFWLTFDFVAEKFQYYGMVHRHLSSDFDYIQKNELIHIKFF